MNKKNESLYASYFRACKEGRKTSLHEVCGKFSKAKLDALDYCKSLQFRLGGREGTIVSHNSFVFTYAFKYSDYDTGKECLCYCTPSHDYKFCID